MYVCIFLFDRVITNHSYGGMMAYVDELHGEVLSLLGIKWKSSHENIYEFNIMWL